MTIGLDDLNNDLQNEAGATPPTATAQDSLLDGKPHELQVKIMRAISARKLDQNDPILDAYNCTGMAAEAAAAAGQAAKAVQSGVSQIPDQIFSGAVRASDEVKGGLVAGGKLFAEAFVKAANERQAAFSISATEQQKGILDAANLGAEKIKTAAVSLTSSLDKAVQAKTAEGVGEFAKAAAVAGQAAARSSMLAQASRSAMVSVLAFIFACMIGAGGLWGYLLITHRVMPAGVVAMQYPMSETSVVLLPDGAHAKVDEPIPLIP